MRREKRSLTGQMFALLVFFVYSNIINPSVVRMDGYIKVPRSCSAMIIFLVAKINLLSYDSETNSVLSNNLGRHLAGWKQERPPHAFSSGFLKHGGYPLTAVQGHYL